jgi:polygalacturonase
MLPTRRHFLARAVALAAALPACALAVPPPIPTSSLFDVKRFGAKGDGRTLDSPAVNAAIAAAAAAGGGTVYFPPGRYLSASIRLKSNITLYLEAGAVIEAVDASVARYDLPEPNEAGGNYQDYGHSHWQNSLIWGIGLDHVAIVGGGLIHGKGLNSGHDKYTGNYTDKPDQPGEGDKAIALRECRNVTLRDFSILHGGHFGILATGCSNMLIDHLTIDTNRDGMDIDACINVRVTHCSLNTPWDDAICLKASYGLGRIQHCETSRYPIAWYREISTRAACLMARSSAVRRITARGYTAASSWAPNRMATSRTSPSPTAFSTPAAAWRSKAWTVRTSRT